MLLELRSQHPAAYGVSLSLIASFWGAVFLIAYKAAIVDVDRPGVVFFMLLSAALASTIWSVVIRAPLISKSSLEWKCIIILAVLTVLGNYAIAASLEGCDPALVSVILQIQIFLIALLEFVFLRSSISKWLLLGAVIAVSGFVWINFDKIGTEASSFNGMFWALVAAASFSCMLIITKHVVERIDVNRVNMTRLGIAAGAMLCWPGMFDYMQSVPLPQIGFAALGGLSGLVISRLFLMNSVRYISATQSKLITLSAPIFTLILAYLFLSSIPSNKDLIGSLIILIGVALPLLFQYLKERHQQAS